MTALLQWVPKALYVMWQSGITHVTWFTLRDDPMSKSAFQSGLYFNGGSFIRDRAKPFLANFRFPVVGIARAGGLYVWGRTPGGAPGRVVIQTAGRNGWHNLLSLTSERYGIFQGTVSGAVGDAIRAVVPGTSKASGRYALRTVPDHFYNPFGTTPPLEPH